MNAGTVSSHARKTLAFLSTKRGKRNYAYARNVFGGHHLAALSLCARIATGIDSEERLWSIASYIDQNHRKAA